LSLTGAAIVVIKAGDVRAAGLEVDDEPDDVADQTAEREDLDGEEVGRGDRAEVRPEAGLPRHCLAALGRGFQAMLGEDALDRVSSELMTEVAERAEDPGVAPGRVLGGELDDQALQRNGRAGSSASSSGGAVVAARRDAVVGAVLVQTGIDVMACPSCPTGRMQRHRPLSPGEIDQVAALIANRSPDSS
jgi:hypothetical protein